MSFFSGLGVHSAMGRMFFARLGVLLMLAGLPGRAEAKDTKKAAPAQTTTQPQGTPPAVPPASATAPLPPGAMPKMPDQYKLNLLIRTTIIAINQANKTGNCTVLRDLAAPDFQNVNSAEKLAEIFTGHIRLGCTGFVRSCVSAYRASGFVAGVGGFSGTPVAGIGRRSARRSPFAAGSQSAFAVTCVSNVTTTPLTVLTGPVYPIDPTISANGSYLEDTNNFPAGTTVLPVLTAKPLFPTLDGNFHYAAVSGSANISSVTTVTNSGNDGGNANNTACGTGAVANNASGFTSAYGAGAQATGVESTAIGGAAMATNQWTTSVGVLANASGLYSTAMGVGAGAGGEGSIAIGADRSPSRIPPTGPQRWLHSASPGHQHGRQWHRSGLDRDGLWLTGCDRQRRHFAWSQEQRNGRWRSGHRRSQRRNRDGRGRRRRK